MKKVITIVMLMSFSLLVNAASVGNSVPNHSGDHRHPLCRHSNNLPRVCKKVNENLIHPAVYSFACSFCPVCDENGQLVTCGPNDLPAKGKCCVDVDIDLQLMNQLPSHCKIDEGQKHPCGQCPIYYKKDHSCIAATGKLGELFPSCFLHNGPGGDGECPPYPSKGNQGKPKNNKLTPVKPNKAMDFKSTNPSKKSASLIQKTTTEKK